MTKERAGRIIRYYISENLNVHSFNKARRLAIIEYRVYMRQTLKELLRRIYTSHDDPYIVADRFMDDLLRWRSMCHPDKVEIYEAGINVVEDILDLLEVEYGYE